MNQAEFEAACATAILAYHDAAQDGPLLVSVRMNAEYLGLTTGWHVWPEYAAVIGRWPAQVPFGDYGQFMTEPQDCLVDLVHQAKHLHSERQPEPVETDPERQKLDALLD